MCIEKREKAFGKFMWMIVCSPFTRYNFFLPEGVLDFKVRWRQSIYLSRSSSRNIFAYVLSINGSGGMYSVDNNTFYTLLLLFAILFFLPFMVTDIAQ